MAVIYSIFAIEHPAGFTAVIYSVVTSAHPGGLQYTPPVSVMEGFTAFIWDIVYGGIQIGKSAIEWVGNLGGYIYLYDIAALIVCRCFLGGVCFCWILGGLPPPRTPQ